MLPVKTEFWGPEALAASSGPLFCVTTDKADPAFGAGSEAASFFWLFLLDEGPFVLVVIG